MLLREFSQLAGTLVCDCMKVNGLGILYTCSSSAGEMSREGNRGSLDSIANTHCQLFWCGFLTMWNSKFCGAVPPNRLQWGPAVWFICVPVCGYLIARLALIQCVWLVAYLNQWVQSVMVTNQHQLASMRRVTSGKHKIGSEVSWGDLQFIHSKVRVENLRLFSVSQAQRVSHYPGVNKEKSIITEKCKTSFTSAQTMILCGPIAKPLVM